MLVGFLDCPHEIKLLEGNIHDKPPNGEVARSKSHGMSFTHELILDELMRHIE
jgi:hypothetical protein